MIHHGDYDRLEIPCLSVPASFGLPILESGRGTLRAAFQVCHARNLRRPGEATSKNSKYILTDAGHGVFIRPVRDIEKIKSKFKGIEPGLTITSVANLLHTSHNTAREWALIAGYQSRDGRGKEFWRDNHPGGHRKADWQKADWRLTDQAIAEVLGVSRTRVWQKRKTLARLNESIQPTNSSTTPN